MIYYVKVSLIAKKEKGCLVLYFGTLTYFVVGTYRTKHNAGLGDTFSRIKLSHRHRSSPLLMEKYFPFQGIEPTGVVLMIVQLKHTIDLLKSGIPKSHKKWLREEGDDQDVVRSNPGTGYWTSFGISILRY